AAPGSPRPPRPRRRRATGWTCPRPPPRPRPAPRAAAGWRRRRRTHAPGPTRQRAPADRRPQPYAHLITYGPGQALHGARPRGRVPGPALAWLGGRMRYGGGVAVTSNQSRSCDAAWAMAARLASTAPAIVKNPCAMPG